MSKTLIAVLGVVGVGAVLLIILAIAGIGTYNTQASLQNRYEMKLKDNTSQFDNMWKKISQTTQIADKEKDAFKDIFTSYANARTSEGSGKVMSWIQERVPNVQLNYGTVLNIITGSRDSWTMRQTELVDVAREYNQNLVTFPKNLLLGMFGFKHIDPKVITSSRTEETFDTGKDDDVNLTGQPKPASTNQ